jgi:hypothetical protein
MNHIEFFEKETSNYSGNSISARIHLEDLHCMSIDKAKEAVKLYQQYIQLKEEDIFILSLYDEKSKKEADILHASFGLCKPSLNLKKG